VIHLLVFFIYRTALAVARCLPIERVFAAGELVGICAFWMLPRRRRLATENLRRAFHDKPAPEIEAIARDHFRLLGANLFACAKLETMTAAEIRERVTLRLFRPVPPVPERRGWVAMISHLGNWELFSHLAEFFPEYRFAAIYQPLANRLIDRHLSELRRSEGVTLFDRRGGLVRCIKFLQEGGALGVLVDQFAGVAGVWAPLFRRLTSTSHLAPALATRAGVELVPIAIYTTGRARWTVSVGQPRPTHRGEATEDLAAWMNTVLEELICRAPADWLWSHDRWKTPRPRFLLARDWRRFAGELRHLEPFRIVIRAPAEAVEAKACLPAVEAIRAARPDAWVAVVGNADLRPLFSVADFFIPVARGEGPLSVSRAIRRAGKFDAAITLPRSWSAALAMRLAGIPCRAGHPSRFLLNYWVMEPGESPPPDSGPDRYLRIAEVLGAVLTRTEGVSREPFQRDIRS
jgi:heptosyltransferase-2